MSFSLVMSLLSYVKVQGSNLIETILKYIHTSHLNRVEIIDLGSREMPVYRIYLKQETHLEYTHRQTTQVHMIQRKKH